MKRSEALFGLIRIPLDALAVWIALMLSYHLRAGNIDLLPGTQLLEPTISLPSLPYYTSTFVAPSILLFILFCAILGLYGLKATMSAWREVGKIALATLLWVGIVIAWYFLVKKQLFFSRALLLHGVFFLFLFATALRMIVTLIQRSFLYSGVGKLLVVSIGRERPVASALSTLEQDVHYQYLGHLQTLDELKVLEEKRDIDLVLQTDPAPGSQETLILIDYCRSHHLGYGFLPPVLGDVPHLLVVEHLGLVPYIRFQPTPLDGWGRIAKRIFDLVLALIGCVILFPLFLILSLGILLESGWPVLYFSKRIGQQGKRLIHVLKFRSMRQTADQEKETLLPFNHRRDGPLFKMKDDPRITPFGKFLRRWSLDEMPQLINVLKGEMSLVGPRPHLSQEVALYSPEQRRVFAVKPGITGLAQISGRSDLSFEEEVRLDLKYIEEWSLLFDVWILWRTGFTVLSRRGAD